MRAQIQECNFLTRKRIRFRFKRFIQQFSQCCTTARDLKLKYLLSMESLEKSFYTETFQVREASRGPLVILVAADSGVQWCRETFKDSDQVGRSLSPGGVVSFCPTAPVLFVFLFVFSDQILLCTQELQLLCDFPDVTDISIKQASKEGATEGRVVTINKQDGKNLVLMFYLLVFLWSVDQN